ncbi:hypothetical protein GGQ68_003354 [Sagittula marina]|uniref:Uncharacterized protein n=1 Tax=Sagittula marina TaxID=943940 RepID=A0A7W6DPR5_9RHOB|nr:hypothetical protein [Sagittula marina]MBB3987010.1 hypothetical protein [Sagittula marina]
MYWSSPRKVTFDLGWLWLVADLVPEPEGPGTASHATCAARRGRAGALASSQLRMVARCAVSLADTA